ncbi:eukaryotic translation initiation factor 3 subunit I isoform X2 [Aegilops tauschii subsp. strangulata]|uniref:eukaryotic translation initiation factor 3 subunit I isoform X2 n=1 Tax=Aegilops tauschii subsp. strangulata TaxID=200361 RepID=UPI00098A56B4|nr:eukaryotic translation initiation factor 3 subunit I isoform X2 [Aegilops tauschii subsp. strangulata]
MPYTSRRRRRAASSQRQDEACSDEGARAPAHVPQVQPGRRPALLLRQRPHPHRVVRLQRRPPRHLPRPQRRLVVLRRLLPLHAPHHRERRPDRQALGRPDGEGALHLQVRRPRALRRLRHRRPPGGHHHRQLHGEDAHRAGQAHRRGPARPYETEESALVISGITGRINRAVWGPGNRTIITAGEDATIRIWDSETGKLLKESDKEAGHQKAISSLSKSLDWSHFLTGSLDKSAKLWDARTLTLIKTYVTELPVNAVDMSPTLDNVVIGGGQDAMNVTMTDRRAGKFEAKFFHKILQEEIGGVKGHFGPINALAFNPDGKRFSSGGEDGYVRLHHFDPEYFNIKM